MIIPIKIDENSYEILIEDGALGQVADVFDLKRKVMIVTDSGVPKTYSEAIVKAVKGAEGQPYKTIIPAGEASKSLRQLEKICEDMLNNNFSRKDCVVAVGGGVVGDLAGFAAACYMRGIDFYNIPTTLLSQVDSSVGGKTAVNFGGVKNILGAFHQPKAVLIDPQVLSTLSPRQFACGCAEIIKMAITFDEALFCELEKNNIATNVQRYISESLKIKARVVEADERESGLRKALNFGHTLGHGIESTAGLMHGEAVALGMIAMCGQTLRSRLVNVLKAHKLPTSCDAPVPEVVAAALHDKKSDGQRVVTVKTEAAGDFYFYTMSEEELKKAYLEVFG